MCHVRVYLYREHNSASSCKGCIISFPPKATQRGICKEICPAHLHAYNVCVCAYTRTILAHSTVCLNNAQTHATRNPAVGNRPTFQQRQRRAECEWVYWTKDKSFPLVAATTVVCACLCVCVHHHCAYHSLAPLNLMREMNHTHAHECVYARIRGLRTAFQTMCVRCIHSYGHLSANIHK